MNLKPTPALQLSDGCPSPHAVEPMTMSGMYLTEGVIWLNDPTTSTNTPLLPRLRTTGRNWSRFYTPEIDELHYKYRNSLDVAARKTAYQRIQDLETDTVAPRSR